MQRKAESALGGCYQPEIESRIRNKWMAPTLTCLQWIQQLFNFLTRGNMIVSHLDYHKLQYFGYCVGSIRLDC